MIAAQRSLGTKGAMSENLKDTELEDEQELTAGEANELDQFEAMLEEKRASTVWSEAGEKKDEVIRKLIKVFSSFVAKYDEDDDITGRTQRFYEKLPDAHIAVVKARV
jgi:hypothetical protein